MTDTFCPVPGEKYFAYTANTPEAEARAKFVAKFGYDPENVGVYKGLLWCGPMKKVEVKNA